jgi:hypothetical protein
MNEQDIRALVRDAIERHLSRPGRSGESTGSARLQSSSPHPSHIILNVLPGSEVDEGACVIEPAVRCNHCGFCQSYGH